MPVKGAYLALAGGGAVLMWSGLTGKQWTSVIRNLIAGQSPATATAANIVTTSFDDGTSGSSGGSVTASGGNASGGSNKANEALGKTMAAGYGWGSGAEWTALNNLVMSESGWNDTIANPTSDARGIAQNINGWGPGYEEGNAAQQISWLLNYVKTRYGDPIKAWAFHRANNWY